MKLLVLLVVVAISCTSALSTWQECVNNCLSFSDYSRGDKSNLSPAENAIEYCRKFLNPPDDIEVKLWASIIRGMHNTCKQIKRFSELVHIFMKAGIPRHRFCRYRKICPTAKKFIGPRKLKGPRKFIGPRKLVDLQQKHGKKDNGAICTACKITMYTVRTTIKFFNYSEQKIKKSVEFLCKMLSPLKIQSKICKDVLDEIDSIIQWVLKGLSPGQICVKLKFCNSTLAHQIPAMLKIMNRYHPNEFQKMLAQYVDKAVEIQKGLPVIIESYQKWSNKQETKAHKNVPAVRSGEMCKLCMTVTNLITYTVKYANASIEAVEEAVRLICDAEPGPIKKMCLGFLSKINEIIQYIEKGLTPKDICKTLGFCTKSDNKWTQITESKPGHETRDDSGSKAICGVCDSLGNLIKEETGHYKQTMRKMRSYMTEMCKHTKNEQLQERCVSVAPMFIMIDSIASRVFDPKLCKKLICNKPFLMAASLLQRQKSTPCDICHYAVKMLDMRFKYFNELVQRTLSELDQICGYIAYKELSSQCHKYVNSTEALFNAIVKKLNSTNICAILRLCPKAETQNEGPSLYEEFVKIAGSGSSPTCGICKVAVEAAQGEKNAAMVRSTLKTSCKGIEMVAGKKVCKKLVNHVDFIIGKNGEKKSPEMVCKKLLLCEKELPVMELLGGFVDGLKDIFG
eukprot:Seg1762.12 transcript_id=Seg1762.12/GoldUCD/mRNA.D3Y31 product=Prosaposin protein_id=Seg1762.12/GoldUCD/D3Y31